jgi:uncharacterized protein (TIGR02118 family)
MLKFVVVLYRRPDVSPAAFHENLRHEHGAMAERLPGLRRYIQNHVVPDRNRPHPGRDAVVELFWDDWAAMEAAWKTPEGQRATSRLAEFVDLSRTTWSVVSEEVRQQRRVLHPRADRARSRVVEDRAEPHPLVDARLRRSVSGACCLSSASMSG